MLFAEELECLALNNILDFNQPNASTPPNSTASCLVR
jgi:hypothetical protein